MFNSYQEAAEAKYHEAKKQMDASRLKDSFCGQAVATGINSEYRPSLREESEQRVGYHRTEADRADRAAAFFRENPAFDEFIRLIREGVVQI